MHGIQERVILRAKVGGEEELLFPPIQGWEYYVGRDPDYCASKSSPMVEYKWESDPMMECSTEVSPAILDSAVKKIIEEKRTMEEVKRLQPLAAEVDSAIEKGDIARVKELQQLETSGN